MFLQNVPNGRMAGGSGPSHLGTVETASIGGKKPAV